MNTYSIEPDSNGGFQVRVTGRGADNGHITTGFRSELTAQAFINNRHEIEVTEIRLRSAEHGTI